MKILIGIALVLALSGSVLAEELLKFSETGLRQTNEKRPGAENFKIQNTEDGSALSISWTPGVPTWVETMVRKPVAPPDFNVAEFFVNAYVSAGHNIKNMTLRFTDAKGECFQIWTDFQPWMRGKLRVRAVIDKNREYKNSFGGNNDKRIDPPLRFSGIVCGIQDTKKPGEIRLESVEYREYKNEHVRLIGLHPSHPLSVILPGNTEKPSLEFRNSGTEEAQVTGVVAVRDIEGKEEKVELSFSIPSEGISRQTIPLIHGKYGVRYVEWHLKSMPSGRELRGGLQFALMKPFEERGRKETFLFGSAGVTEPRGANTGRLAQKLTGVKNNRGNSAWYYHRPKRHVWNYEPQDRQISRLAEYGIKLQYVISSPPAWAVAKDYKPKNPALKLRGTRGKRPDYEEFRKFLDELSTRYKGKIPFYIVGNEPDLLSFCNFSEEEYIEMLKIAYTTIKKNDPEALVMCGGISSINSQYPNNTDTKRYNTMILQKLLNEGKPYYDVFAFHGHGPTETYLNQLRKLRSMGAIGGDRKWLSEETGVTSALVGEKRQAEILFQKLILAWAYGAMGLDWYNFYDLGTDPKNWEHRYGILTNRNEPKPAFLAYATVSDLLYGGRFLTSPLETKDVHVHQFRTAENSFVFPFWSMSSRHHLLLFSGVSGSAELSDPYQNRTLLTSSNGTLLVTARRTPAALILHQDREVVSEGVIFSGPDCSVTPGKKTDFHFKLRNPLPHKMKAEVVFTPPEGIKGGGRKLIQIAPGKEATLTIPLIPGNDFTSYVGTSKKMRVALTLDGIGSETLDWDVFTNIAVKKGKTEKPTFILDREDQVQSWAISGPENHLYWQGKKDLGAEIWLSRTDSALLLKAVVSDDIHSQEFRNEKIWNGDSVQFVMEIPHQGGYWTFGLAHLSDGTPQVWCWDKPIHRDPVAAAKAIKLKTERNEAAKTTIYMAEIPFRAVGLTEASGKRGFRFNLLVNDNDGPKRENCIRIVEGIENSALPFHYPFVNFQ